MSGLFLKFDLDGKLYLTFWLLALLVAMIKFMLFKISCEFAAHFS